MAQMTGLFSGVDPEMVRQQEMEKRQGNNLALAQSSNPFASTMFTGLNLADELRNKTADVFGNPIADSPAVAAAKEDKLLEEEVARMVMEGRQAGKTNDIIAQEVQAFLQGKGKFNKAEQYRTNLLTEEQTAAKNAAEVEAKKAAALKDTASAGAKEKQVAAFEAALKKKYPKMPDDMIKGIANDEQTFKAAMAGEIKETGDGVFLIFPDGSKILVGSAVDRSNKTIVDMTQKGNQSFVEALGKSLPEIATSIQTNNQFIGQLQQAKEEAIRTVATADRYSGATGEPKRFIASTLEGLGLLPPGEMEKLVNSDKFASATANLLLTKTGGKIGVGFSVSDLQMVERAIGNAMQNPKAFLQILNDLEKTAKKTNSYLRNQYEWGRSNIAAGAPLPLGDTFNEPTATPSARQFTVSQQSNPDLYKKLKEDAGYRDFYEKGLRKQGKVLVLE